MSETKTGPLKYVDLISKKFADTVDAVKGVFTAKLEEKNLEMKIIQLQQTIAQHEATIATQKAEAPINWEALSEAIDDLELAKRRLVIYQTLQKELF